MLTATAVISAVDNASGVFARVGAAASRAAKVYQSSANAFASASHRINAGVLGAVVPAGAGLHAFAEANLDWDEQVHRFRAITEMSATDFEDLRKRLTEVSNNFGIRRGEILEGAIGWKEAGGKLDEFRRSLETYASIARITKTPLKEAALETRGLMLAFGEDIADPAAVKRMEEFFLVASKNIKHGAPALIEAMKNSAPIAAKLHWKKEDLAALISVGVAEGFQPGEIGRGWKTVPMRMFAPPRDAIAAMRAANVDMMKLYGIDEGKVRDTAGLERALEASGLHVNQGVRNVLAKGLTKGDFSNGLGPVADRMTMALSHALGIKKGDAMNRKIIAKAVDQHIKRAASGIDIKEMFKLKDQGLDFWTQFIGKEHAAKILATLRQEKLFDRIRDEIKSESEGAIERKGGIFFEGLSHEFKKLQTAWENLLGSVGGAGVNRDFANVFATMSGALRAAQDANPEAMRTLFWGLSGLAAAPAIGFGLMGLKETLAFLASPQIAALAAAGGIAALLGGKELFSGQTQSLVEAYGPLGEFFGPGAKRSTESPAMRLFREMSNLFREISAAVSDAVSGILSLFSIDVKDKPLLATINALAGGVGSAAASIREIRAEAERYKNADKAEKDRLDAEHQANIEGFNDGVSAWWYGKDPRVGRFAQPALMMRDIVPGAGPAAVDVTGKVDANVTGEATVKVDNTVRIQIDGPGRVVEQSSMSGEARVPLDTGRSMRDTGVNGK